MVHWLGDTATMVYWLVDMITVGDSGNRRLHQHQHHGGGVTIVHGDGVHDAITVAAWRSR
jgi:hypothetical protein